MKRFPRAGRGPNENGWMTVAGNFIGVAAAKVAMGIDWMNRDEMAQAIPPAYTEYIGRQLMHDLSSSLMNAAD